MGAGVATPAFCAKRAFEKQGHTVFLFTPKMWPELFDEAGTFDGTTWAIGDMLAGEYA